MEEWRQERVGGKGEHEMEGLQEARAELMCGRPGGIQRGRGGDDR